MLTVAIPCWRSDRVPSLWCAGLGGGLEVVARERFGSSDRQVIVGVDGGGVHRVPQAAEQNDAEVENRLGAAAAPAHAGEFEPLGEDGLTGGLGDAAADGQSLAAELGVLHVPSAAAEIVVRLPKELLSRGGQRDAGPHRGSGMQHAERAVGFFEQLPHPGRPGRGFAPRAEQGLAHRRQPLGGVIEIDDPLPRQALAGPRMQQLFEHLAIVFGLAIARVGEIDQSRQRPLPLPQHFGHEGGQLVGHRRLAEFRGIGQIDRAQSLAAAVIDRQRGGAGDFVVAVRPRLERDAVAAHGQHGAVFPFRFLRLPQPVHDLFRLMLAAKAFHRRGHVLGHGPQLLHASRHTVTLFQPREDGLLRGSGFGQQAGRFAGQGRRRPAGQPQLHLQRKDRCLGHVALDIAIAVPQQRDLAKQRRHFAVGHLAVQAAVLPRFVPHVLRQFLRLLGFEAIVSQFQNHAAHLPQQFVQLTLEGQRRGGRCLAGQETKRPVR